MKNHFLMVKQSSCKSFLVEGKSTDIIDRLEKVIKKSFVSGHATIEFKRHNFDPFAPNGTISIEIIDNGVNTSSIITYKIASNLLPKYSIWFMITVLSIWIMFSFLLVPIGKALPMIILGSTTFYIIFRWSRILNLAKLENYAIYLLHMSRLKYSMHNIIGKTGLSTLK